MSDRLTIIVDTREQRPWCFPEWVPVRMATLPAGDYALDGDAHFAIERKNLDDFVGTVFSGWERFRRELGRMEAASHVARVIVVEADYSELMFRSLQDGTLEPPAHRHPAISPAAMAMRIAELALMGVTVLFCHDPGHAALQAYYLLATRWRQLNEGCNSHKVEEAEG